MSDASEPPKQPAETTAKSLKLYSCALCHRRKVKCDKKDPCTYCVKNRVPCVPAAPTIPKPRKRRFPEAELLARLKRYETALRSFGADIDSINNGDIKAADRSRFSPGVRHGTRSPGTELVYSPPAKDETTPEYSTYATAHEEFEQTQDLLQGSSGDENDKGPITSTYDSMFENDGSSLLFGMTGLTDSVDLPALHPPPMQIFSLWQVFMDNVNLLTRVFHAPTVQQQILKVCSNLGSASSAMHALMFGIYAFAVISLDEETCLTSFNESKHQLLSKYQTGAQCALHSAGFLRSSDLTVLQALMLYLTSIRQLVDPRSLFCLTAIAERIGRRNGLQRDIQHRGVSIFEVEMKKRLWWNIVLLEYRVAEQSGAGTSLLNPNWNTKLPLNINDNDLNLDMSIAPHEHSPATDMIFFLVRCEIAEFHRQIRASNGPDLGWSEFGNPAVSLAEKLRAIGEFEQHLQDKYLSYCDSQIPLHVMAKAAAEQGVKKMQLQAYTSRFRSEASTASPPAFDENRDRIFQICTELIESFNMCKATRSLHRFNWYLNGNIPFLAFVHILVLLRYHPVGDMSDRAWTAVTFSTDIYRGPRTPQGQDQNASAMSYAFANLISKAWEAREAALGNDGSLNAPKLVVDMRAKLAGLKSSYGTPPTTATTGAIPSVNVSLEANTGTMMATAPGIIPTQPQDQFGTQSQDFQPTFATTQAPNSNPIVMPNGQMMLMDDMGIWDLDTLMPDNMLAMGMGMGTGIGMGLGMGMGSGGDIDWNQFSMYR